MQHLEFTSDGSAPELQQSFWQLALFAGSLHVSHWQPRPVNTSPPLWMQTRNPWGTKQSITTAKARK